MRGHGVLETEILAQELGPFDATFHVPAFLEGGRTNHNGIHFLNGIPVHKTIFAKIIKMIDTMDNLNEEE